MSCDFVMSCHVTSSCHVMSCDFVHQKKLSCWKKGTKAVKLVERLSLRRKKNERKKRTSYREKKSVMANLPLQHASLKNCLEISYINVIGFKIELLSNYGKASEEL